MVRWQAAGTQREERLWWESKGSFWMAQFEKSKDELTITGKDCISTCKIRRSMLMPTEYSKFAFKCIPLLGFGFGNSGYLCNYEKHYFFDIFFYILKSTWP